MERMRHSLRDNNGYYTGDQARLGLIPCAHDYASSTQTLPILHRPAWPRFHRSKIRPRPSLYRLNASKSDSADGIPPRKNYLPDCFEEPRYDL
jgi:hypothetical protein